MAEITRRLHPRQRRAIVSQLPVAIPNSFSRTGRLRRLALIVLQRLPVVISFHFASAEIIEDDGRLPNLAFARRRLAYFKDTFDCSEMLGKFESQKSLKVIISEC
ncbi:MAG: hypothetical protein WCA59_00950 [Candidatus Binataceae bacterium]